MQRKCFLALSEFTIVEHLPSGSLYKLHIVSKQTDGVTHADYRSADPGVVVTR